MNVQIMSESRVYNAIKNPAFIRVGTLQKTFQLYFNTGTITFIRI